MITKIILTLTIVFLMTSAQLAQATSHSNIDFKVTGFASDSSVFDNSAIGLQAFLLAMGVAYDESENSSQRRGTENWEESQSSFLIFPGIVLGLIALAMFFSRD